MMTPCTLAPPDPVDQWLALTTLPALMQPVQTLMRLVDLPTTARTRWMLGFQRRLVRRWEWLSDLPNQGFLPQISQTDAITHLDRLDRSGHPVRSLNAARLRR